MKGGGLNLLFVEDLRLREARERLTLRGPNNRQRR